MGILSAVGLGRTEFPVPIGIVHEGEISPKLINHEPASCSCLPHVNILRYFCVYTDILAGAAEDFLLSF
jgi:hypothetical protein